MEQNHAFFITLFMSLLTRIPTSRGPKLNTGQLISPREPTTKVPIPAAIVKVETMMMTMPTILIFWRPAFRLSRRFSEIK